MSDAKPIVRGSAEDQLLWEAVAMQTRINETRPVVDAQKEREKRLWAVIRSLAILTYAGDGEQGYEKIKHLIEQRMRQAESTDA